MNELECSSVHCSSIGRLLSCQVALFASEDTQYFQINPFLVEVNYLKDHFTRNVSWIIINFGNNTTFCSFLSCGVFFNFLQNIFTYIAVRLDTIKLDIGQFQVGRVQISQHGQWGGVCGTGWDDRDARVTCRELGYPYAKVRKTLSSFYRPQRSYGKVMFSQASVILFTEGGACMAEGCVWQGGMRGRGRAWQERRPLQRTIRILLECILV